MGPQEDYIETVFTCEGDINDPNLQSRLEDFRRGLRDLLSTDKRKLILKKVEPWNSVRVTFNIPREAASRLKQLAQQGNTALRQLGVLAVQIEGDQLISLTIAGRNNEPTRLFFHTSDTVDAPSVSVIDSGGTSEFQSPGPSSAETTKKNIENYLRQQSAPIFDSLFGQNNASSDVLRNSGESSGQGGPFSALNAPNSVGANPLQGPQVALGRNPGYPSPASFMGTGSTNSDPIGHHGLKLNSPSEVAGQPVQNELSLPPPPPYPHGSTMLNNYAKAAASRFGGTSTTSPLLVNLLQNEPSLAGINNFINNKMLPPPEASPPPKKKRKPRKPKDKTNKPVESQSMAMHPGFPANTGTSGEVEISIQSVPNPALNPSVASCGGVPLVTSGSSSNMPTIPMVTQALPATTQPAVTYSSQGRQPGHLPPSPSHHEIAGLHVVTTATKIPSSQDPSPRISESGDFSPFLPENTAGKIINPYTGLLEPMDNSSDTSPNKSDSSLDGFSPHKSSMKRSPMEKKIQSTFTTNMSSVNNTFHQGQVKSDWISSVPTTASGMPEQIRQPQTQTMSSYKSSDVDGNLLMPSLNLPVTSAGVRNVQSSQRKEFSLPVTSLQSIPSQVNRTQTDFLHGIQPSIDFVSRSSSDCVGRQTNYTAVNSTVDLMTVNRTSAYSSNVPFGNVVGTTSALSMAASDKLQGLSTAPKVTQQLQPLYRSVHKSVTSSLTSAYDDMDTTSVCFSTSQITSVSNTHPSVSHKQQQPALRQQQKTLSKPAELSSPNSSTNSEHLLNPHVMNHPAKNSSLQLHHGSNREVDSPGGDSENSSQSSLLHDQQAQNDVAPLEAETKVYNHDSGIGSSSERSDGTPSEPGDDFKGTHTNHTDECGIKPFLDGVNKSCIPKSDSQVITVGYAMSNSHMLKEGLATDILSMTKTLNHSTFNNSNCHKDKTKIMNNIDPGHQVTVLHWSTKDKILSNQIESNKRKSPKQFLRDDSLSQVMSGKQASPYTTEHLQHMQNLMKLDALQSQAVEYAHQYGDNRPKIGGKANVDFSTSTKRDENTNRRSPFSSLAHQSEVARASPLHMVNNHIQGRGSPRINDSVGRVSPRINEPLPRVSVSQVEDIFNKCNNDHSIPQLIHPASRPSSVMSSMNQGSVPSATTTVPTQNYSYMNPKLYPRTTHSDRKAKSPVSIGNSTAPMSGNVRMSNMENGPVTFTTSMTNSRMTTGKNQTSTVGVGVQNRLQDSIYCQANCDDDVSIVSVSQVSKSENCALKTTVSSGLDQQKPMSSLSLTTPSSSVQYSKRRSPVNSSMNSLTQHFFDPALPLAKRLTESVQKLVKPLPSINLSSLPHCQHKPAVGITSVAKSSAVSSPPRIMRDNKQNVTDALYANVIPPSTDILSYSHHESANVDEHVSSVTHSGPENNHASLQESAPQCSASNYISDHPDKNCVDPPNVKSVRHGDKQVHSNSNIVQSTVSINTKSASETDNDSLKQVSDDRTNLGDTVVPNKLTNVKGSVQSQHRSVDTVNCAQNESNKPEWDADSNNTPNSHSSSHTPQLSNPRISVNGPSTLNSEEKKIESNMAPNKSTVVSQDTSFAAQMFDKVDNKSIGDGIGKVLTAENGSQGEGVSNVMTAVEDASSAVNAFNQKPENSQMINDSEIQKQVNLSDSKPSTDTAQLSDESPTTMALRRTRKLSESSENLNTTPPQHNLRQTRQRVNPSETDKDTSKPSVVDTEASKNLRTSRRRKTVQNDVEGLSLDISKKTDEPEVAKHTRSADVKDNAILPPLIVKNDVARTSLDNPELMETVKSGLRNRTQNKVSVVEDKNKSSNPKDLKRKLIVPEDDKKMQQNKRSRHSPTLSQDKLINASRDKSPVRGSRTRGQTPQNIETQEEKRSTRSSKPKDATETLPPSNKRRRSSRDHR